MEIQVTSEGINSIKTGAVVLALFEGEKTLRAETAAADGALGGAIRQLIEQEEIRGKYREITFLHTLGRIAAAHIAIIGLGKSADFSANKLRGAIGETCRWLRGKRIDDIAVFPAGTDVNGISQEEAAQAITEGAMLGLYTFRSHITKKDDDPVVVKRFSLAGSQDAKSLLETGSARGKTMAEAAILARDLENEPSNFMTPTLLAAAATGLAQRSGLKIHVLERERMEELGMGALLGVARGSKQPPKFIILEYKGKDSPEIDIALVGKGITFDSGGISIKPSEGMDKMKGDKGGGVAVLAAMGGIARLKPKINVAAYIPATENMPGGNALKPGDILTTFSGQTIEILSTDAEGRLILADALGYARKQGAKKIVDVATLTGACRIALGEHCSGAFGNNQEFIDRIVAAGKQTGELMWQLPMFEEYREQIKSDVADLKNTGGAYGGAITAAKFLADFVGDVPWVHLDIAATSMTDKERGYLVKGATGVPVRALISLVLSLAG